jgi:hypothetical protein
MIILYSVFKFFNSYTNVIIKVTIFINPGIIHITINIQYKINKYYYIWYDITFLLIREIILFLI